MPKKSSKEQMLLISVSDISIDRISSVAKVWRGIQTFAIHMTKRR